MDEQQIATRLAVTEAMAGQLDDYLMRDTLYQHMLVQTPHGTEQPVMTLGALLANVEFLRRHESSLSPEGREKLTGIERKVAEDRRIFSEGWHRLLRRELKGALDSWKWYLDDAEGQTRARENYRSEVHLRTRIDLIMRELGEDPSIADERKRLAELDARLRSMLGGESYSGPRGEQESYPPDRAWWLYGTPGGGRAR